MQRSEMTNSVFDAELSILDVGVTFSYRVPSFSVLHVDLRQIKFQVTAEDGSVLIYDGFIKADPSLEDRETPYSRFLFVLVRRSGYNCKREKCAVFKIFIVSMSHYRLKNFVKMSVKHLTPVGDNGLLIVWQWSEWADDKGSEPNELHEADLSESLSTASDLDEEEPELNTVTLKCIGVTRDSSYQIA